MKIRWESGATVEYGGTKIIFDPQPRSPNHKASFITHAHVDHSYAFRLKYMSKFSSEETMRIVALDGCKVERWQPLTLKGKVRFDDIEVTPHPAGHVLGSYEFEVNTPDGTVLFTGDINTRENRIVAPAEPVECDVVIIESTYGSPGFTFPPDEIVADRMVRWANEILGEGKIPVFQADAIGNAQEIVRIFNENTNIPVISHTRVSRVNEVYRRYGHKVEYIDIGSGEASELISNGNAVVVAPKRLSRPFGFRYVSAIVSGWSLKIRRESFPLSDHADFPNLIDFVVECKPKMVLTYHGGRFNEVLAKYIERRLGVRAYPIDLIPTDFSIHGRH